MLSPIPPSDSSSSSLNSCSSDKSMEHVWQNINNLPCLDDNSNNHPPSSSSLSPFTPTILLDFLASPARRGPSAAAEDPVGSRAGTMLSLHSGSGFHRFSSGISARRESLSAAGGGYFDSPAAVSVIRKRPQHEGDEDSCDRRHKRRIKNRESAARSRARKQAYAQELEMEVAQLREENARLREKLLADQAQFTRKKEFYRSSSAPL